MFFEKTQFPEPSAELIFANGKVNRQSESRTPDCLEKAMANPGARAIVFAKGRVMVQFGGSEPDPLFALDVIEMFNPRRGMEVLLGYEGGVPILAISAKFDPEIDADKLPDNIKAIDYRSLAIQGLLHPSRMGEVAQGASLLAGMHLIGFAHVVATKVRRQMAVISAFAPIAELNIFRELTRWLSCWLWMGTSA